MKEDFNAALRTTKSTNDPTSVKALEAWNEKHGDGRSSTVWDELRRDKELYKKQSKTFKAFSFLLNLFN